MKHISPSSCTSMQALLCPAVMAWWPWPSAYALLKHVASPGRCPAAGQNACSHQYLADYSRTTLHTPFLRGRSHKLCQQMPFYILHAHVISQLHTLCARWSLGTVEWHDTVEAEELIQLVETMIHIECSLIKDDCSDSKGSTQRHQSVVSCCNTPA